MYKVAICDVDVNYRKRVKDIIMKHKREEDEIAFYEYDSGEELIKNSWRQHELLFMDIKLKGIDGYKTAKLLRQENETLVLVFCTNCTNPMPDLFKVRPYRYIIKDAEDKMLKLEIADILEEVKKGLQQKYLNVTSDGRVVRIPIKSILYISVIKRGASIHLYSNTHKPEVICRESIRELYAVLEEDGFEYAHNSYIVNLANIIMVRKNIIELEDHTELNISRSKQKNFDKSFSDFLDLKYKRK